MKFIDEAIIQARAGHGGAGATHFHREKFVPYGGPDGGNGGSGGSVIVVADPHKNTLLDLRYKPQWFAKNGQAGQGNKKDGKSADNLKVPVPVGTQIFDEATGELVADLDQPHQEAIIVKGGRGGKGNAFFKSSTNRTPTHSQPGEEGEEGEFRLSLKLLADVGLVGFPNAGKSTLISTLSAVKPKIADYPFTTLEPNLGVVKGKGGNTFVMADIPGLIPGAHSGKGLGIQFLKHIERTRVILHLVDPRQLDDNGEPIDPLESYEMIENELKEFSEELSNRKKIVLITKIDTYPDTAEIDQIISRFKEKNLPTLSISSVSRQGLEELVDQIVNILSCDSE